VIFIRRGGVLMMPQNLALKSSTFPALPSNMFADRKSAQSF
jgi:hypothetical protein